MAAPTAPRRKPPRKPAAKVHPTPLSVIDAGRDDGFVPLQFTTPTEPEVEERATIAYLDDYALTMPLKVPPNIALKVMRTSRKQGNEAAMGQMLEEVLGEAAYSKLADYRHLSDEDLAALIKVVQRVAMGALEIPKASSASG